ncbi:hypothetical protein Salat_2601900 [Sesamum alatum]|uniref:RNase H type-1 domain-containing protein n=1 Tax=Sesamum alatum TaxID=300844 RepID=A0AAE2CAE0_9LAMI|nr:hypothetical protein Salat_2601900 [Sesamum alatum]
MPDWIGPLPAAGGNTDSQLPRLVTCCECTLTIVPFSSKLKFMVKGEAGQNGYADSKPTGCEQIIARSWSNEGPVNKHEGVWNCIDNCKVGLFRWSDRRYGNIEKKIQELEKEISEINEGFSAEVWLRCLHEKLDEEQFGFCVTIIWNIWYARNKLVMEKENPCPMRTVTSARNNLWNQGLLPPPHLAATSSWTIPPTGVLKINFDAAIFGEQHGAGVGVVVRDWTGSCVRWMSKLIKNVDDPTQAEALAAREANFLASLFPGTTIESEGDCLVVIKDINAGTWEFSSIGPIIRDIILSVSNCPHITFHFVRRSANAVAHKLARLVVMVDSGISDPTTINNVLSLDVLPSS